MPTFSLCMTCWQLCRFPCRPKFFGIASFRTWRLWQHNSHTRSSGANGTSSPALAWGISVCLSSWPDAKMRNWSVARERSRPQVTTYNGLGQQTCGDKTSEKQFQINVTRSKTLCFKFVIQTTIAGRFSSCVCQASVSPTNHCWPMRGLLLPRLVEVLPSRFFAAHARAAIIFLPPFGPA